MAPNCKIPLNFDFVASSARASSMRRYSCTDRDYLEVLNSFVGESVDLQKMYKSTEAEERVVLLEYACKTREL